MMGIVIPSLLRKEMGIKEGDNYLCSVISLNSPDGKYKGARAILVLPVVAEYKAKIYSKSR